ncbi:hypothetical protein [Streptomyces sp. NPDC001985]|uniref:hypothetical protein n=1 Tax=Streptomyces sp. NPDC001985 TaxID=3154406 RepID=UPI0033280B39
MARREVTLGLIALALAAVAAGGLWWWAVLRLVLVPERSGLVEGAVAAGGWGLSLLPVHVTAHRARGGVRRAVAEARGAVEASVTRASSRRRSDG